VTRALAVPGSCDLVWVEGDDAQSFLQGLLTNDVAALQIGETCPSLILDNTGHVRGAMRVHRDGPNAFTLITATGQGAALADLLDEYHFSEAVEVIGPEPSDLITFLDDPPPSELPGADLVVPGLVPGTTDAIGADATAMLAACGRPVAPPAELEYRRVAAGLPLFGVDYGAANLVQEAGLDTAYVSFDKGCYLGQETVARVHYRGQVNRRLAGVLLDAPAEPGAAIHSAGKRVGTLTSVARSPGGGHMGLAILRREVGIGDRVDVEGLSHHAVVAELPFARSSQLIGKRSHG
jgi:folate-binding protein YgfZ